MLIRQEGRTDYKHIRELNDLAFGSPEESQLIDNLRSQGAALLSLVAEDQGDLIGHIFFSRIQIVDGTETTPAVSLAPMCVSSVHQKKGVGGALIHQGLRMLKHRGEKAVFVLGHKRYYPKFGFSADLAAQFKSEYSGDSFFALELQPGWMENRTGTLVYPEAFSRLS
ncbi:MAG TPA: N-acetyltransferase [Bryobacteraceae bacterium]|jgi:putative acetyltransferase